MCSNTTISVKNISKCFQIYDNPRARLKQFIFPRVRQLLGKEHRNYFQEFWALNDISFNVKKGETVGIVGRNGSGKSTLLQIICGTLFSTHGSVETTGRISALLELGAGFNPDFTGHENIYTNGAVLGMSKEEIDAKYEAIVAFADIGDFVHQPVRTYSSGMYVRLAFSVAIHCDPEILIVDEALAVGDVAFQRKCFATIEKLKQQGCSILFVSHDVSTVISLCDRAVLLSKGKLLLNDTPKKVCDVFHKIIFSDIKDEDICLFLSEKKKEVTVEEDELAVKSDYIASADTILNTIYYPSDIVTISHVKIVNMAGEQVNRLVKSENYVLVYDIHFKKTILNILYCASFKTVQGVEIFCPRIEEDFCGKNFKATIQFPFKCLFLPGDYFCNVGIWSTIESSPLCRIVDVCTFQVLPEKSLLHGGYVDLFEYNR